jgi:hypothetical protein
MALVDDLISEDDELEHADEFVLNMTAHWIASGQSPADLIEAMARFTRDVVIEYHEERIH